MFFVGIVSLSIFAAKPENLGPRDGRLARCPDSPNCVSSQADDPEHFIEPIAFSGAADAAMKKLRKVLKEQPRTKIVKETDQYLHAESRSRIFRFVDDLEFLVDADAQVIHVRSASRMGHSDLGVNRARIETIREAMR